MAVSFALAGFSLEALSVPSVEVPFALPSCFGVGPISLLLSLCVGHRDALIQARPDGGQ